MKKIFEYELADAWGDTISKVTVTNTERDNVICVFPCISPFSKNLNSEAQTFTVTSEIMDKIENVYLDNIRIFELDKIEESRLIKIDGYIHYFNFCLAGVKKGFQILNIDDALRDKIENAIFLMSIVYKIANFLVDAGVDKKYFSTYQGEDVDLHRYE